MILSEFFQLLVRSIVNLLKTVDMSPSIPELTFNEFLSLVVPRYNKWTLLLEVFRILKLTILKIIYYYIITVSFAL